MLERITMNHFRRITINLKHHWRSRLYFLKKTTLRHVSGFLLHPLNSKIIYFLTIGIHLGSSKWIQKPSIFPIRILMSSPLLYNILYSHKSLEYSVTFKCWIQIANNVILIEDVDGFWIPSKISDGKKCMTLKFLNNSCSAQRCNLPVSFQVDLLLP